MKKVLLLLLIIAMVTSCNTSPDQSNSITTLPDSDESNYVERKIGDKWVPDQNTRQELLALQNTIVNFNLLKTKIQSIASYKELGFLVQNHIERINKACLMEGEPAKLLHSELEILSSKVPLLQQDDLPKLTEASKELTQVMKQIESTFHLEY